MECIWLDGIRDQLDWLNKNEKNFSARLYGWAEKFGLKRLFLNSKLYDCYCKQKIKT
jgi:hypothetical protein